MHRLEWYGDYGFYPANPDGVYDQAYFDKYVGYAHTSMGEKILERRLYLLELFAGEYDAEKKIVDVGIGCGQFVEAASAAFGRKHGASAPRMLGYDVNPAGIEWLTKRHAFFDPTMHEVDAMTFWDSLEHIKRPETVLLNCRDLVFVSLPIFQDKEHVLRSKHFRPDEHYWYWTKRGLESYMKRMGFRLIQHMDFETQLGREDIETFVFRRPFP